MYKADNRSRQRRTMVGNLRRFHADTGGQITMLTVFGAVILVSLLGMIITSGDQVSQKLHLQNSVDASALSGGVWIARGLNITSGFNLLQTQLMGGAIVLLGLDSALQGIYRNLDGWIDLVQWCPTPWCGWFRGINRAAQGYAIALRSAFYPLIQIFAACPPSGTGLFWLVGKGLEALNHLIYLFCEHIAFVEARDVGKLMGVGETILIPGPTLHLESPQEQFKMPTRRTNVRDHCDPMEYGSRGRLHRGYHPLAGYRIGEGPLKLGRRRVSRFLRPFIFVPWVPATSIFNGAMNRERDAVCAGRRCPGLGPKPYLLNPAKEGLKYLVVARLENKKTFFFGERIAEPPTAYSFAQIELYNAINRDSPDTYTQDWRVRLAPASLASSGVENLSDSAVGLLLDDFVRIFLGIDTTGAPYLQEVVNH